MCAFCTDVNEQIYCCISNMTAFRFAVNSVYCTLVWVLALSLSCARAHAHVHFHSLRLSSMALKRLPMDFKPNRILFSWYHPANYFLIRL